MIEFQNRNGSLLQIQRETSGNVTRIVSPNGKWVALTYDSQDRIIQAKDSLGRMVSYQYDPAGRLVKVLTVSKERFRYEYDSDNRMTGAWEGKNRLLNDYEGERCIHQVWWKAGVRHVFTMKYQLDEREKIREAEVTEPDGSLTQLKFNANGYTMTAIYRLGQINQITVNFNRDKQQNILEYVNVNCTRDYSKQRMNTNLLPD